MSFATWNKGSLTIPMLLVVLPYSLQWSTYYSKIDQDVKITFKLFVELTFHGFREKEQPKIFSQKRMEFINIWTVQQLVVMRTDI